MPCDPDLETALHCLNVFYQKAEDLQYDGEDHFTNFASLLEGSEFTNYQAARAAGPQNTIEHFQSCMHRFSWNYCGRNAKEHQYQHFTTDPEDYKKSGKDNNSSTCKSIATYSRLCEFVASVGL